MGGCCGGHATHPKNQVLAIYALFIFFLNYQHNQRKNSLFLRLQNNTPQRIINIIAHKATIYVPVGPSTRPAAKTRELARPTFPTDRVVSSVVIGALYKRINRTGYKRRRTYGVSQNPLLPLCVIITCLEGRRD